MGYTRTVTYDAIGRKVAETDFLGNITAYTYDNAGRLLTVTTPISDTLNSVTKYHYDANGNVIKTEQTAQAEGEETKWRTIEQVYDNMNRVTDIITHVSDTEKQYTHYEYNLAGDLTGVYTGMTVPFAMANVDSYSHISYTYDARGNNTSLTDALGQTESYTYDSLGMVVFATQRDGKVIKYTYNALGSIVSEEIYENADAKTPLSVKTTVYALTGAPLSVTIDGVKTEYTYNAQGNVLTETEGDVVKTYTYDSRGRKSSYTLTVDGEEKSSAIYSYDNMNRLTSVAEGGLTTTYTYDANGNRTSQTTGEVTTEYTYNKANLVTDMTNTMVNAEGDSVVISSFEYTYYADGNMHTKSETLLDTTTNTAYVYDGAGRLVSETAGDKVISYYYDANNNRTLMNNGGVITSYTYDKNNRLLTEGDIVYTYDANGNTLTAGNKTYIYNARGQQIGYSDGETSAQYAYNPSGLRSAKTVGGSTKYFVYNGMNIVYEYEKNILAGTAYYYGLNRTHNSDGEIYVYNAHGDTVQLVKDNAVTVSYTYDAFGNLTSQVGESDNPFLYCSEYFDSETQTYYLRARYYDPANGRFTQEDPIGDGLNWYIYSNNNPIRFIDPSGLSSEERLGEGIWSLKNDEFGISILTHWLYGNGMDYIHKEGVWGKYMKENTLLTSKVKEFVLPLADDLENNSSKDIDIVTSMVIQNGEDIIGYQYLHGTNADVGDFHISGTISKNSKGDVTYDLVYTWNDIIDPNFIYSSDSKKAEFAKSIPFANPTDYTIRISWSDKTTIKDKPKWYSPNSGWLK